MCFMQKKLEDLVFRTPADTELQQWWFISASKAKGKSGVEMHYLFLD